MIHAKCEMSVVFSRSCSIVSQEMQDRAAGKNGWVDPHNAGSYVIDEVTDTTLSGHRVTGDLKYTDKFDFHFTPMVPDTSGCIAIACSESQSMSIKDYSTNYCNLHNLYCGSDVGCKFVNEDLYYDETYHACSQHDDVCIVESELEKVFA